MKIVFFSPHARIWQHSFPEALVAEALKQGGHEIVYVTCGRQLARYCVCMGAQSVAPDAPKLSKEQVCSDCCQNASLLRDQFGLVGYDFSEFINTDDDRIVDELLETMTPADVTSMTFEGIQVGRYALYQLLIRRKRIDLDFSDEEWSEYLTELRNTLYAAIAARKILDQEKPDRVIVYNSLYPVTRAFCKAAEQREIPHYFLHAGANLSERLQTLMLARGDTFSYAYHSIQQFDRFSGVPCTQRLLANVTDHHLEVFRGRSAFAYSAPKGTQLFDVRRHFGIRNDQKLLLATMSSYDEDMAAELAGVYAATSNPLFASQIEWVRALLDFVKHRSDLFLVIRVHPREFPNRREGVKSQHAAALEEGLQDLPANAAVNWPDEAISLYDLADQTDVVLNAWSSAGRELALFGLPVVSYEWKKLLYSPDINLYGDTQAEYFECIERALREGWSAVWVRKAYRWGAFEFVRATVQIGESYGEVQNAPRPLYVKIKERILHQVDPLFRRRADCRLRRNELESAQLIRRVVETASLSPIDFLAPADVEQAGFAEETAALRHEMRRLADVLYPNELSRSSSRLYSRMYAFH